MYSVLIVDDEQYALDGLVASQDWGALGLFFPQTALGMRQAREVLAQKPVDILLCDVEMPDGTGLELARWIREHMPDTAIILVTCHERFEYARDAIELNVLYYLVKPVYTDKLQSVLQDVVKRLDSQRSVFRDKIMSNRFWRRALVDQPPLAAEQLEAELYHMGSPYDAEGRFTLLLICANAEEAEVLTIFEGVLNALQASWIPLETSNAYLAVAQDDELVSEALTLLPKDWEQTLDGHLAFRDGLRLEEIRGALGGLLAQLPQEKRDAPIGFMGRTLQAWSELLTGLRRDELFAALDAATREHPSTNARELTCRLQNYLQMLYVILDRKEIPARALFDEDVVPIVLSARSDIELAQKLRLLSDRCITLLRDRIRKKTLEQQIMDYVEERLPEGVTRKDIADHFYLNPDYISRLFKSATGKMLSDYVIQRRIDRARQLLTNPDFSVTEISEMVGYSNYSYFARVFRQTTGMRPADYRRQLQRGGDAGVSP